MRRLMMLAIAGSAGLVLASSLVGGATASPRGAQHTVYSNNWQGITFVNGIDACPVFGAAGGPNYVFQSVDLTDHINGTSTPIPPDNFLNQFDSVGSVHGVINASDGTYRVAGGGFKENRTGPIAPSYFSGTGHLTISGPGGTVSGQAVFQDLLGFPPPEFDLLFTSVTSCHLK